MIVIVDNGKGAEDVAKLIRTKKQVMKPENVAKASAYILSDGDIKNQKTNEKIIKNANVPVLGIGCGSLFIAAAFGAKIKKIPRMKGQERMMLKKPCPLTLDMKRMFTVYQDCQNVAEKLPENFTIVASSPRNEFGIIQDIENPFFGVQFNPECGGDGIKIIRNFEKFVEMWEKYHR